MLVVADLRETGGGKEAKENTDAQDEAHRRPKSETAPSPPRVHLPPLGGQDLNLREKLSRPLGGSACKYIFGCEGYFHASATASRVLAGPGKNSGRHKLLRGDGPVTAREVSVDTQRRSPHRPPCPSPVADPALEVVAPLPLTAEAAAHSRRGLWLALIGIALVAVVGIDLALWLRDEWMGQPDPTDGYNVFFVLFSRNEPAGLALVLAFTALGGLWLWRGKNLGLRPLPVRPNSIYLFAAAVFALAMAGYFVVFHEYSLTADENMADFQARIFLAGHLRAILPPFWEPMARLIMPVHAYYFPESA